MNILNTWKRYYKGFLKKKNSYIFQNVKFHKTEHLILKSHATNLKMLHILPCTDQYKSP